MSLKTIFSVCIVGLSVLLTTSGQAWCQTTKYTVVGKVVDSEKAPLTGTTIMLLQKADSVLYKFALSKPSGEFEFKAVNPGEYVMQFTFIGFHTMNLNLKVDGEQKDISLGEVPLVAKSVLLDAANIEAEVTPIVVNGDTIEYNAAAFKTQADDMVEDLLRKLPGIEVERDGTIKAQGEEVQKVLVDGKEFFGNDAKMATRNLPASAVEKVQVYDKLSDIAEFTGIDDGNREKTINLALKQEKKQGYFGNLMGGVGTKNRYQTKINVNKFSSKTQLSFIRNANNINESAFSFQDYVQFMGGFQSIMASGGTNFSRGDMGMLSVDGSGGIMNSWAGGLNLNHDFSDKTELRSNYFYSDISNSVISQAEKETFTDKGDFLTNTDEDNLDESGNHRINFKLKHKPDSTRDITIKSNLRFAEGSVSRFSTQDNFVAGSLLQSNATTNNQSFGRGSNVDGNVTYRKKLRRSGRSVVLELEGSRIFDDRTADLNTQNIVNTTLTSLLQSQNGTNEKLSWQGRLNYTEPLGKSRYVDLNYTHSNRREDSDRAFYDLAVVNDPKPTLNTALSNQYINRYHYDLAVLKFSKNTKNSNFQIGLGGQYSGLDGELISADTTISKSFSNLLPELSWKYRFTGSRRITLRYNTRMMEPSVTDLQPVVNNTNPLNIFVGNPDLGAEYRHSLNFNFMNFSQFSFTSLFTGIRTTYTSNKISQSVTVDANLRQIVQPVNVPKDWSNSVYAHFSTPLKFIGSKINLETNYTFNRGIQWVNAVQNNADRHTPSIDVSLENRNKEKVDLVGGVEWSKNNVYYSIAGNLDQSFVSVLYYTALELNISPKWNLGTSFDYTVYSGQSFATNQTVPLWKASIERYFLKQSKGLLKFSVFDLLNQNNGVSRTAQLNFLENKQIIVLGRYYMLSFTYSLSGFDGKKQKIAWKGGHGRH